MYDQQDYERDQATYVRMKDEIARSYPHGWFVGIYKEQIVTAAATLDELIDLLRSQGIDPRTAFAVEAGVDYPDFEYIFSLVSRCVHPGSETINSSA